MVNEGKTVRPHRRILFLAVTLLLGDVSAYANVIQVEIDDLAPFTDLREFGDSGDFGVSQLSTGERFVGQTTTFGGLVPERPNEILSGIPLSPLELEITGDKEGVCFNFEGLSRDRGIAGLISDGQGTQLSCGEGSVAFLFGEDQSQIGVRLGEGPITLQFFSRNGDALGVFDFDASIGLEVGFFAESANIAGFSFHNLDFAGTILRALYFGSADTIVTEPGTLALFGIGLFGMVFMRRKQAAMSQIA